MSTSPSLTADLRRGQETQVLLALQKLGVTPEEYAAIGMNDVLAHSVVNTIHEQLNLSGVIDLTLDVEYDDPQWQTIQRDRYAHVGEKITVADCCVLEMGTKSVRCRLLSFDHSPSDEEVLVRAAELNCRQPNRAEAETVIRRYTPEQFQEHPIIGLIGPSVLGEGDLRRLDVHGFVYGVGLFWHWTLSRWRQDCLFVVVCKKASTTKYVR